MGPRLHSRGMAAGCRGRGLGRRRASMGPRLHSRGMGSRSTASMPRFWFSFNGAAASQPRNDASSVSVLFRAQRGFNGAAASQPRNEEHEIEVSVTAHQLQWGRGFTAAEWSRMAAARSRNPRASMGPRLHSRGMREGAGDAGQRLLASMGPRLHSRGMVGRASSGCRRRRRGFNGAAASQPRNGSSPNR